MVLFKLGRRASETTPSKFVYEHSTARERKGPRDVPLDHATHYVLFVSRRNWLCSTFVCARFSRARFLGVKGMEEMTNGFDDLGMLSLEV